MLNLYPTAEVDNPYEDCLRKNESRDAATARLLLSILRHMISYSLGHLK